MKAILFYMFLLLLFTGCYEDKGNYNYHDVSSVSIDFLPATYTVESDGGYKFVYKQPGDSVWVTVTANASRIPEGTGDRLIYTWITKEDTLQGKELRVCLPAKEITSVAYMLKVTDPLTALDFYQDVRVKTIMPYLNGWFVLHGLPGDMKLGSVESNGEKMIISPDVYLADKGVRRFQNATGLSYSRLIGLEELMAVFTTDSCFSINVRYLEVTKLYEEMMPPSIERHVPEYGVISSVERGRGFAGVVAKGLYYHTGHGNIYYTAKVDESEILDYSVGQVFIDDTGTPIATIWDKANHRFLYYPQGTNGYSPNTPPVRNESLNTSVMRVFPHTFSPGLLDDKEVLWIGPTDKQNACIVLLQDSQEKYNLYELQYSMRDQMSASVKIWELPEILVNGMSSFASSRAFTGLFFYSVGNALYRYDYATGTNTFLYETESPQDVITKIAFREFGSNRQFGENNYRILGLAVKTADGQGELHQVGLTNAGEFDSIGVYRGFAPITDFVFAAQNNNY